MRTLRASLVSCVLSSLAGATVIVCAVGLHTQQMAARGHLEQTHESAARTLADSLREPLMAGDDGEAARIVRQTARGTGIDEVRVYDSFGRLIAAAATGTTVVAPGRRPPGPVMQEASEAIADSLAHVYVPQVIRAPVQSPEGQVLATVEMTLADRRASTAIAAGILPAALAGLVLIAVAGGAWYRLAARVSRPLDEIERMVDAMNRGDFGGRLDVRGAVQLVTISDGLNDVTTRLTSMAASTNFVNNVIHSMVDTLMVVDQQAKIKAVNQATLDLLGFSEAELVGRTASLVFVADGRALTAQQLEELLGYGSKKDHEVTYIKKGGGRVPISLSGSAIKDGKGQIIGYVCIGTDITNRKEAETERERLHKQLVTTSRQAGMAEVATGVLHNVGNVLNSVNVAASVVEEGLTKSKVSRLAQVADLIKAQEGNLAQFFTADERGKVLPGYLLQLSKHLADEQSQLIEEVRSLGNHIGHIKDIISVQQSISKTAGMVETVDPKELVEDAVLMVDQSMKRHDVAVVREFEPVGTVTTDKHKVLQILVNLLSNSVDAIKETGRGEGKLTIRVGYADAEHRNVRIEVADNGVGIDPENLTRIFTHGFTTKKTGHGFGLHASALSAHELQGSIAANSEGKGTGATFILTLPCEREDARAAKS